MKVHRKQTASVRSPKPTILRSCLHGLVVNSTVLFWGLVEANLGLLAACLPTLRGLLKTRTMDSLVKSYRSRTWLRSAENSNKATAEQDSLPFAHSPSLEGKKS